MKKYLTMISVLALVACNDSNKAEEAANRESEVRQRTIDSMAVVNASHHHHHASASTTGEANNSAEPAQKKGMSNTTKGALIGTGAGITGGALTGAAVSKDKGKGAVVGGLIGGAVGSGVGYGVGAHKDKKDSVK